MTNPTQTTDSQQVEQFNARFTQLYESSLRIKRRSTTKRRDIPKNRGIVTHTAVAERLRIPYKSWLYQRKDPRNRIHADTMMVLAALFDWNGEDLMSLYHPKGGNPL